MGKGKGGWPSKNPGQKSGEGRDNNSPKQFGKLWQYGGEENDH